MTSSEKYLGAAGAVEYRETPLPCPSLLRRFRLIFFSGSKTFKPIYADGSGFVSSGSSRHTSGAGRGSWVPGPCRSGSRERCASARGGRSCSHEVRARGPVDGRWPSEGRASEGLAHETRCLRAWAARVWPHGLRRCAGSGRYRDPTIRRPTSQVQSGRLAIARYAHAAAYGGAFSTSAFSGPVPPGAGHTVPGRTPDARGRTGTHQAGVARRPDHVSRLG